MLGLRYAIFGMTMGLSAAAVSAAAPDASFFGSWTVTGSAKAPGMAPDAMQDPADIERLVGARLRFSAAAIAGPRPLACRGPRYELKQYTPDMLFQGTLTDAAPQARALGFAEPTVRTLETGCEGTLDFHFIDTGTALFMLNNRIYTIKRDRR